MASDLDVSDRPSSLAHQIETLTQNLDWTLAHFAFVANVTSLADECDVAHSPGMSVASCHRLLLPALAFVGESADLLANYATFLMDPGSDVYVTANAEQRPLVETAFEVHEVFPQWQMVFKGDATTLDPGPAVTLEAQDEPAIHALSEASDLLWVERDPLAAGPAFGIRKGRKLLSMATTRLRVPGAAEIGNVVTLREHHRKGYTTAVVSALVRMLSYESLCVFLHVFQDKPECLALYQKLGFEIVRPMYWMQCIVKEVTRDSGIRD